MKKTSAYLLRQSSRNDTIPGSYIIVLKNDSTKNVIATRNITDNLLKRFGGHTLYRYEAALHGYAVDNMPESVAKLISHLPAVAYVEPNMMQRLASTYVQGTAGSGLDRIDQRVRPLDGSFGYNRTGNGVNIYIIDSGVDSQNPEFSGRIGNGATCVGGDPNTSSDSFGHGTAVASVAAGTTYGVAKNAIIHSVRVTLDGYNVSTAAQVCGINWVASQGQRPAVANLSIGGVGSAFAIRDAINGVTAANITFVKAAGNDYVDAFQDRGNRANNEIVVGATDPTNDTFASFSDYGPTISILAPGVNVLVADRYNPGYAKYASGTSFAAPYVAGVAAAFLESSPDIWPGQVKNTMISYATYYQIQSVPSGTTDALLNDLYIY